MIELLRKSRALRRRGFPPAALALLLATSGAAEPLAPSQVTPASLAPTPARLTAAPQAPAAAPVAIPPGADALRFRLRKVLVEGGFAELAEPTQALVGGVEGRDIAVSRLYELAGAIEKLYVGRGYPLARVVVPAQDLRDGGDARLQVIDGFIESLSLEGVPKSVREPIAMRAGRLVGVKHLTLGELERAVLIAGDVAGVRLRSGLKQGQQPGGTVLELEADWRLLSASFSTDNDIPKRLGGYAWNMRLALNSALGWGEQAYFSYSSGYALAQYGFPMSPLRTLGFGLVVPIGADGLTINPEYTNSRTRPDPTPGVAPSVGFLERVALRAALPMLRTREQDLTVTGALEGIDQRQYAYGFGQDLSHDRYAALRLGVSWTGPTVWGPPVRVNAQVSQGLGGREAGAGEAPLTRQGAAPVFSKINGDVRLDQPAPGALRLTLVARGQWAFGKPLLLSEQFALDGQEGASAFLQGTFSVDSGATLRAELSRPFSLGAATVGPYLFVAQGAGALNATTPQERSTILATAFGLGVRLDFNPADVFAGGGVAMELSRGLSNVPGERSAYRLMGTISSRY